MATRAILTPEETAERDRRHDQHWNRLETQGDNLSRAERLAAQQKDRAAGINADPLAEQGREGQGVRT
jgi:hypothetical protein